MKLLVIIVTYNGRNWIEKCLNSVFNSTISNTVMVIDNGSTDGTVPYLRSLEDKIIFIKSEKNLGFGKANNIGLKYALEHNFDYVYLLNQDAWVFPDTFESLIKVSEKNPDYGILSPLQITASGEALDKNFSLCCPPIMLSDALCSNLKELYECNFVMAAHWLINNKCLQEVGGFSPAFPHYGEDHNYIQRVQYKNLLVGISPNTKGIHDREFRTESDKKKLYIQYIQSLVIINNPKIKHKFIKTNLYYLSCFLKYKKIPTLLNYYKTLISYFSQRHIYKESLTLQAFI